jgi:hypothetical protein
MADGDIGLAVALANRRRRDQERVIEEVDTAPIHLDEDELPLLLRRDDEGPERRRPGAAAGVEIGAAETDRIGPEADLAHGNLPAESRDPFQSYPCHREVRRSRKSLAANPPPLRFVDHSRVRFPRAIDPAVTTHPRLFF